MQHHLLKKNKTTALQFCYLAMSKSCKVDSISAWRDMQFGAQCVEQDILSCRTVTQSAHLTKSPYKLCGSIGPPLQVEQWLSIWQRAELSKRRQESQLLCFDNLNTASLVHMRWSCDFSHLESCRIQPCACEPLTVQVDPPQPFKSDEKDAQHI